MGSIIGIGSGEKEISSALTGKEAKSIGRLGAVFFIYKVPKEKAMVEVDRWTAQLRFANFNTLENIVGFIPFEIGNGLPVDKEADFGGDMSYCVHLPDEKFIEWYNLDMRNDFKKGELCGFCDKEIESSENFSLWGGVAYHRKDCFAKSFNERWKHFHESDSKLASYLLKVIENFDKNNPILKNLKTKFSLVDIPQRIGSAYENYFVTYILHPEDYKGLTKEEAEEAIGDELINARKHFEYAKDSFLENWRSYWKNAGLTERRARVLFDEYKFVKRIEKIFEEGENFSGIDIHEVSPYIQISNQCETLFNLYSKKGP